MFENSVLIKISLLTSQQKRYFQAALNSHNCLFKYVEINGLVACMCFSKLNKLAEIQCFNFQISFFFLHFDSLISRSVGRFLFFASYQFR